MNKPNITAIVPMRHDSVRVPGKNWRPLGELPLFCHVIQALQDSHCVERIVIDTDSPTIRAIAGQQFPDVILLERPAALRDDKLPMNDVLLHTTAQVPADLYLQTHSTNPLLRAETIDAAVRKFVAAGNAFDSLFAVTRLQQRLWDAVARPLNHNAAILMRTQDLPPVYAENSCIYLFSRESLVANHNRVGHRPMMFEIDRAEAWDIDDENDFVIAEMLFEAGRRREVGKAA